MRLQLLLQALCYTSKHCLQLLLDPGVDRGISNASIYTRLSSFSTALTPRNSAQKSLGPVNDGAAAVTLARVLASSGQTGTPHAVGDLRRAVVSPALGARDNRDGDLSQSSRKSGASLTGGSPSS
jgi:hypothetical protein